jgi:hypothetical protein
MEYIVGFVVFRRGFPVSKSAESYLCQPGVLKFKCCLFSLINSIWTSGKAVRKPINRTHTADFFLTALYVMGSNQLGRKPNRKNKAQPWITCMP